jgi:selenide,water dikinase
VFRLDAERALVQTVDFFPPIVDDPRWFGRIAAANSLSDVYAMGGKALTAMNLVGWPKDLDIEILGEIMAGGNEKIVEAGAVLCGGHSVVDTEIKYGLSVTGIVHPAKFWANKGARLGDVLILTKPIGMGVTSTAIKKKKLDPARELAAMQQMATLNKAACEAVLDLPVHGATDVTGFGLLGHSYEMAAGAVLTLRLAAERVPLFAGAQELARAGLLSAGASRGREYLGARVRISERIGANLADLLYDAETSGGLLLAVPEAAAAKAQQRLADAGAPCNAVVGTFVAREQALIVVE